MLILLEREEKFNREITDNAPLLAFLPIIPDPKNNLI
jgi:hypothetical protein